MTFVPCNPDKPICADCEREYFAECGSVIHPGLCCWCAQKRILAENAARAAEQAQAFQALSWGHFTADAIIGAAARARDLLAPTYEAEGLISDREPLASSERDMRHSEAG